MHLHIRKSLTHTFAHKHTQRHTKPPKHCIVYTHRHPHPLPNSNSNPRAHTRRPHTHTHTHTHTNHAQTRRTDTRNQPLVLVQILWFTATCGLRRTTFNADCLRKLNQTNESGGLRAVLRRTLLEVEFSLVQGFNSKAWICDLVRDRGIPIGGPDFNSEKNAKKRILDRPLCPTSPLPP